MTETLESFVDQYGLANVLENLADICHSKAEHLTTNWQEYDMANNWDKAGNLLSKTISHPIMRRIIKQTR